MADADAMEEKFLKELNSRAKDGSVEIHKDQGLAENPMDRVDEVMTSKVRWGVGRSSRWTVPRASTSC